MQRRDHPLIAQPSRRADREFPRPPRWPRRLASLRQSAHVPHSLRALLDNGSASQKHVVEIQSPRRTGNTHPAALPLPPQGAILRRRFAGVVGVRQYHHVAHVLGEIESTEARRRKSCPGGMSCRDHRRKACLNALANQEQIARPAEPHRSTPARPQHHLLRVDGCLADAVASKESAMNGDRRFVHAL